MTESTSPEQSGDEGIMARLDEPEGMRARVTDSDDVEGHVQPGPSDDAEGMAPRADGPEGMKTRVTDDEDDVEGHIKMRG